MANDLDWKQPALVGGLIVGIASALPGVSLLNCCFCGWALIGGAVAAKMTIDGSERPLTSGDGARIGLFAAIVAAVAYVVVATPIILSGVATALSMRMMESVANNIGNPEVQGAMMEAMANAAQMGPLERLGSSIPVILIQVVLQGGFTVIGGLLGVALFEKRRGYPQGTGPGSGPGSISPGPFDPH